MRLETQDGTRRLPPLQPLHHYQPAPVRLLTWFVCQVVVPVLTGGAVSLVLFAFLGDVVT